MDPFGLSVQIVGAGMSKAGRPRLPMQMMISLLYLRHASDQSDEGVVDCWGEMFASRTEGQVIRAIDLWPENSEKSSSFGLFVADRTCGG
jgi:hypothetical protein